MIGWNPVARALTVRSGAPVIAACLLALAMPAHAQDPVYNGLGATYGRDFINPLPFKHIDVVTGNVLLNFTDLVLPGNAGMNLTISRVYNSIDGQWRFGIAGVPLCFQPNNSTNYQDVDFVTADGGRHRAAGSGSQTMTLDFWRFTPSTVTLEMPNGIVATYGHGTSEGVFLTEVRDAFDNTITIGYWGGTSAFTDVYQHVGTATRHVMFHNWSSGVPDQMEYDGKLWYYSWQTIGGVKSLTAVTLPTGPGWTFSYTADSNDDTKLASLHMPTGATVAYTWAADTFPTLPSPSSLVAVRTRQVSGPSLIAATWTYDWSDNGYTLNVDGPANRVQYKTVFDNNIPVSSERAVYVDSSATDPLEKQVTTHRTVTNSDAQDIPVSNVVTITRGTGTGARTFTTTYTYTDTDPYSNYGQPTGIHEVGDTGMDRTTWT